MRKYAMTLDDLKQFAMRPVSPVIHYPAIMVLGIAIAGVAWLYFAPSTEKAGEAVIATPAKEVRRIPKADVQIKSGKVAVYKGGAKLKRKLNLPKQVIDAPEQEVIAASKIPAGERSHTVTTTINTDTGQSETYVRVDPLPLAAFENRGEIGLYAGVKNGERTIRLQARQDFAQIKGVHIGVIGSIDKGSGKPDVFLGVGLAYKW